MSETNNWLANYENKRDTLIDAHVYDPADEHANCGVGLVASVNGQPRRDVVEKSIHCLLYTSPSPRDKRQSRMPSSA